MVLASLGPDGSLELYLGMGMVAAVNPCGFAMLPAYLSYFLGLDATSASSNDAGQPASDGRSPLPRAIGVALAVSAGFLVVFAVIGTLVRQTSAPVFDYMPWISLVVGVGLVALGVATLAGFELMARLPKMTGGGKDRTTRSMFVFGVSYAVCSIGCSLPVFLSAVAGTMNRESLVDGLLVFAAYGTGMAVVLTTLTVTMALTRTSLLRFIRRAQPYIQSVSGTFVVLTGLYVFYWATLELRTYRAEGGNIPSSTVTDVVTDWSYSIANWIQDVGPLRLTFGAALFLAAAALAVETTKTRKRERAATPDPTPEPDATPVA